VRAGGCALLDQASEARWPSRAAPAPGERPERVVFPVPTAAPSLPIKLQTRRSLSAVNRRFSGVFCHKLDGLRTQRPRKILSGEPNVSEARGSPDLTPKIYPIVFSSFLPHQAWGFSVSRPPGKGYRRTENLLSPPTYPLPRNTHLNFDRSCR
jgi:hypothetical protein